MAETNVNRRDFTKLMAAAVGGIMAGSALSGCAGGETGGGGDAKNICAGKNSCKSKGGCSSGNNGCAGKNDCKGQGGCATTDHHSCKGENSCKGQGGCKSGNNGCAGKNDCKGKGGCKVPMDKAGEGNSCGANSCSSAA
ncbi:MAG: hypothetical protein ACYTGX_04440 [Planctomycetota bacterium]|jgi:hypothetical protein